MQTAFCERCGSSRCGFSCKHRILQIICVVYSIRLDSDVLLMTLKIQRVGNDRESFVNMKTFPLTENYEEDKLSDGNLIEQTYKAKNPTISFSRLLFIDCVHVKCQIRYSDLSKYVYVHIYVCMYVDKYPENPTPKHKLL